MIKVCTWCSGQGHVIKHLLRSLILKCNSCKYEWETTKDTE